MLVTTKIGIDLQRPSYPAVINAVQGDQNTRQLEISLYSGSVAWQVPETATVAMRYCKPDKTKGFYDTMPDGSSAFTVSGNTVSILLAPQILTVPGTVDAQVVLLLGSEILSTFVMQIHVEADPSAGVMESEDYTNWAQWIEAELDKYLEKVKVNGEFLGGSIVGSINMNGNPVYGLPAPTSDDHAANMGFVNQQVRKAAPRNLLDNSDFRNPVMQAGLNGLHGTRKYPIDRWISWNDDVVLGNGFIQIQSTLDQRIDNSKIDAAKNYTLALGLLDGTVLTYTGKIDEGFGTYSTMYAGRDENGQVFVRIGKIDPMVWAALYEGEYTSVTLPEYHPKGYRAELSECQRYYYYYNTDGNGVFFPCTAGITQIPGFLFPVAMRAVPTMTIKQLRTWTTGGFTDVSGSLSSFPCNTYGMKYIELTIAMEKGGLIFLEAEFSADL